MYLPLPALISTNFHDLHIGTKGDEMAKIGNDKETDMPSHHGPLSCCRVSQFVICKTKLAEAHRFLILAMRGVTYDGWVVNFNVFLLCSHEPVATMPY
jgi:hypothetical protein